MRPPRRLSHEEAAIWAQVTQSVRPLEHRRRAAAKPADDASGIAAPAAPAPPAALRKLRGRVPPPLPPAKSAGPPPRILDEHGLDGSWEKRLAKGSMAPDFTLDLHGASLDAAHARLDHGLTLAASQGARLVLLITGRPRHMGDAADRSSQRGAIRAKVMDWLSLGSHAGRIATVRGAHPRHGGAGALYIILKKGR